MTSFADLVQGPGERQLVYGGTRTGKSSYMDWSMRHIQETRPSAMLLVADTKPRFRAEKVAYGPGGKWRKEAAKVGLYDDWASGPIVPNSVAINIHDEHCFRGMWDVEKYPGEIVIMQGGTRPDRERMVALMRSFVDKKLKDRERLVIVDEGLDFYESNAGSINWRDDVLVHIARAGGERNIGLFFGAHRPYGVPRLLNTMSNRVTLFHLVYRNDMRLLNDMGIPDEETPDGNYVFRQYVRQPGGTISKPMTARLALPESYLGQLAAT